MRPERSQRLLNDVQESSHNRVIPTRRGGGWGSDQQAGCLTSRPLELCTERDDVRFPQIASGELDTQGYRLLAAPECKAQKMQLFPEAARPDQRLTVSSSPKVDRPLWAIEAFWLCTDRCPTATVRKLMIAGFSVLLDVLLGTDSI